MKDIREIIKYFFLIFLSTEVTYYIAKGRLNLFLVLGVTVFFTILFALDKYKLFGGIAFYPRKIDNKTAKKDQAM